MSSFKSNGGGEPWNDFGMKGLLALEESRDVLPIAATLFRCLSLSHSYVFCLLKAKVTTRGVEVSWHRLANSVPSVLLISMMPSFWLAAQG